MTRLHALFCFVVFCTLLPGLSIFYCYALYCFHSSTPSERFGTGGNDGQWACCSLYVIFYYYNNGEEMGLTTTNACTPSPPFTTPNHLTRYARKYRKASFIAVSPALSHAPAEPTPAIITLPLEESKREDNSFVKINTEKLNNVCGRLVLRSSWLSRYVLTLHGRCLAFALGPWSTLPYTHSA